MENAAYNEFSKRLGAAALVFSVYLTGGTSCRQASSARLDWFAESELKLLWEQNRKPSEIF